MRVWLFLDIQLQPNRGSLQNKCSNLSKGRLRKALSRKNLQALKSKSPLTSTLLFITSAAAKRGTWMRDAACTAEKRGSAFTVTPMEQRGEDSGKPGQNCPASRVQLGRRPLLPFGRLPAFIKRIKIGEMGLLPVKSCPAVRSPRQRHTLANEDEYILRGAAVTQGFPLYVEKVIIGRRSAVPVQKKKQKNTTFPSYEGEKKKDKLINFYSKCDLFGKAEIKELHNGTKQHRCWYRCLPWFNCVPYHIFLLA